VKSRETLLLTKAEVEPLLDLDECIEAVERAFRMRGEGKARPPGVLGFPYADGGFHIKAAGLDLSRPYFAMKLNGNFTNNPQRHEMPAIQGIIVLCDAENGFPLAVLDSIAVTIARTGAATAVAARYLARRASATATICGCGHQGRIQLAAILRVCPIRRVFAFDADPARARLFAEELGPAANIEIRAVEDLSSALRESDVCVTCTPSRRPFVRLEDIAPGTFVAAVGADSPDKQELDPRLLAASKLVVDVREQCAEIGELHHALDLGLLRREAVHAELSDLAAGTRPGRESASEITVFDSTGTALQDVAAAALVYEKALREGVGSSLRMTG
jgi:alanine dehydrogenase